MGQRGRHLHLALEALDRRARRPGGSSLSAVGRRRSACRAQDRPRPSRRRPACVRGRTRRDGGRWLGLPRPLPRPRRRSTAATTAPAPITASSASSAPKIRSSAASGSNASVASSSREHAEAARRKPGPRADHRDAAVVAVGDDRRARAPGDRLPRALRQRLLAPLDLGRKPCGQVPARIADRNPQRRVVVVGTDQPGAAAGAGETDCARSSPPGRRTRTSRPSRRRARPAAAPRARRDRRRGRGSRPLPRIGIAIKRWTAPSAPRNGRPARGAASRRASSAG